MKARNRARAQAMHPATAAQHGGPPKPEDFADAASDVWEPLLHEALDIIRTLISDHGVVVAETGTRITVLEDQLR